MDPHKEQKSRESDFPAFLFSILNPTRQVGIIGIPARTMLLSVHDDPEHGLWAF